MAATQALLLIVLLVVFQPCLQASAATHTALIRRIRAATTRAPSLFGFRRQEAGQQAAPAVQRHPRAVRRDIAHCFVQVFNFVREISWLMPAGDVHAKTRWREEAFAHEITTKGREAVASFIQPSLVEARGNPAQRITLLNFDGVWSSASQGTPRYYEMRNTYGMLTVRDREGMLYSACVVNYPTRAVPAVDAAERIKAAIQAEVHTAVRTAGMRDTLEGVPNVYRYLTLRDILLPLHDKPYNKDGRRTYLNVVFLYPPMVAYLSSLLPLNRGRISSTSQQAKRLERAKYSLTFQVMRIVGQSASLVPVLPRFTAASFTVTRNGILYLAHAHAARLNLLTESSRYPGVTACNVPLEPGPPPSYDQRANAVDLAVILHNIWCPIEGQLIHSSPDIHPTLLRLTDTESCYALLPKLIRDLVAALARFDLNVSSACRSPFYQAILSRLNEQ